MRGGTEITRRSLLAAGAATLALTAAAAAAAQPRQPRRALLIAQSYRSTPRLFLPNTARDGLLMRDTLARLNFDQVLLLQDQGAQETLSGLGGFLRGIKPSDLVLLFVAGHGVEIGEENLLMLNGGEQFISLQALMETLQERTDTVVVFIDACRNNPYDPIAGTAEVARSVAARAIDAGNAPLTVQTIGIDQVRGAINQEAGRLQPFTLQGSGIKIVFSTDPYNVALDGATDASRNSPFAQSLARRLLERRSLDDVIAMTTGDVLEATGSSQSPWAQGSIDRPIFLAGAPLQRNPSRPRFQVPG